MLLLVVCDCMRRRWLGFALMIHMGSREFMEMAGMPKLRDRDLVRA